MYKVPIVVFCAIIAYFNLNLYCNAATCSKQDTTFRSITRSGLKKNKFEIFIVTSFKFIIDDGQVNKCSTKNYIFAEKRHEQIEMFNEMDENNEILRFHHYCQLEYQVKESFKLSNLSAIEKDDCIEKPENVDVYVAALEDSTEKVISKVTMLHACKIWNDKVRDVLVVKDSIILLFEGNLSFSTIDEARKILSKRHVTFDIRYSFIDETHDKTDLCVCDEILHYYNECPAREHFISNRHIIFGIFVFIFVILCFCIGIYPRLFPIINNRVDQE